MPFPTYGGRKGKIEFLENVFLNLTQKRTEKTYYNDINYEFMFHFVEYIFVCRYLLICINNNNNIWKNCIEPFLSEIALRGLYKFLPLFILIYSGNKLRS